MNYGFLIKEINPDMEYPKTYTCDISGRFTFREDQNIYYLVDLESFDMTSFERNIRSTMEEVIVPVAEFGLKKYFEIFPRAITALKLKAKLYLEKDE